jgi:hypothetical protein
MMGGGGKDGCLEAVGEERGDCVMGEVGDLMVSLLFMLDDRLASAVFVFMRIFSFRLFNCRSVDLTTYFFASS